MLRVQDAKMRHFLINKTFTLSLQTILVVSFSNFLFSSLSKVFLFYKKKECRILFHLVVFFYFWGEEGVILFHFNFDIQF